MKKVIIASKNPVKIKAVTNGFGKMFPAQKFEFIGISVPSDVSDQPRSNAETFLGAKNRANNAAKAYPTADFFLGIEGGIENTANGMQAFAWIVAKSANKYGQARTGTFYLPPKVAELILSGKELGEADDLVFKRDNSKQANGAVGILTDNVIDRTKFYTEAVILALIPFKNSALY